MIGAASAKIRSRLTYANVMATVAVFIALGGVGYAAVALPRNSVGAKQLKKGAVTPAKLSGASTSTLIGPAGPQGATGASGPQGPAGAQGPKGDPGESATTLIAHVSAVGKLIGGSGATGMVHVEKAYGVDFDRDVSGCNPQVTLDRAGGVGSVSVGPLQGDPDGIVIEPLDGNENHLQRPFYLTVTCP